MYLPQLNESLPDLQNRYQGLANISHYGDIWIALMLSCSNYPITATDPPMKWNPDPKHPSYSHHPINTSFPVLFLSNTADPVTPLYAAVKMAKKFVNAGLVELKSEGHCSLGTPSLCLISKVRAYLNEGKVPPPPEWGQGERGLEGGKWEVCERDAWPWGVDGRDEMDADADASGRGNGKEVSAQDIEMLAAWKRVGQVAAEWQWWGMELGAEVRVDWDVLVRMAEERV
jgi:TAP-like protein